MLFSSEHSRVILRSFAKIFQADINNVIDDDFLEYSCELPASIKRHFHCCLKGHTSIFHHRTFNVSGSAEPGSGWECFQIRPDLRADAAVVALFWQDLFASCSPHRNRLQLQHHQQPLWWVRSLQVRVPQKQGQRSELYPAALKKKKKSFRVFFLLGDPAGLF